MMRACLLLDASEFRAGQYQSRLCWKIMPEEGISKKFVANYLHKVKQNNTIVARKLFLRCYTLISSFPND